jgi:hypothetical protein
MDAEVEDKRRGKKVRAMAKPNIHRIYRDPFDNVFDDNRITAVQGNRLTNVKKVSRSTWSSQKRAGVSVIKRTLVNKEDTSTPRKVMTLDSRSRNTSEAYKALSDSGADVPCTNNSTVLTERTDVYTVENCSDMNLTSVYGHSMDIVAKGNGNQYFKDVMVSPDVEGMIASHATFRQDNIGLIHFPKSWTDEMGMAIFDEDCNIPGIGNEKYQFDTYQPQVADT